MPAYEEIDPGESPVHRGAYSIERYLLDSAAFHRGCWIDGDTVQGCFEFPTGPRQVLTRPVFAYRNYLGLHSTLDSEEVELELCIGQGHQIWFTPQSESFRTSAKLEIVNVLSDLETGVAPADNWDSRKTVPYVLPVAGATRYAISQLELVYAHWCSAAEAEDEALFTVQPVTRPHGRDGMLFVSSVATTLVLAEPATEALAVPLSHKQVYHLAMNQGHGAEASYGWVFDERALVDRFLNY